MKLKTYLCFLVLKFVEIFKGVDITHGLLQKYDNNDVTKKYDNNDI